MNQLRLGYLYGLGAYTLWGFFPAYFKLLRPAAPFEVLAHRIVWSMLFMVIVLTVIRRWHKIRELFTNPATLGGIALAATLIGLNWGTYIYGVNNDRVIETALDQASTAARRARDHRRVNAVLAEAPLAALWGPNPVPRGWAPRR